MKLCLHIGTEKTGTTSIQRFFQVNRELLRERGILYPTAPGQQSHVGLAVAAQSGHKSNALRWLRNVHTEQDLARFREELLQNLRNELEELPYSKVILSSEHCSSRLHAETEVQWLKDMLRGFFEEIDIVVYLRRQDDFLLSNYTTAVKGGGKRQLEVPHEREMLRHYDHWNLLTRWADVFGRDRIICRKFERRSLRDEDVVSDILDAMGVDRTLPFEWPMTANESLDADMLEFLRLLNHHLPRFVDSKINRAHTQIGPLLSEFSNGALLTLPRESLDAFMNEFEESNRKVATEYFGGESSEGDPLFGKPSDQRERVSAPGLTLEKTIEISAWLWSRCHEELEQLKKRVRKAERMTRRLAEKAAD